MPGGRPTLYKPEYVEIGRRCAETGMTEEQLAAVFDVNIDTLYEWRKRYPEFSESLKGGKDDRDERVERSLLSRAEGGYFGDKYYPPDATSMIFWLKNRQPKKWRDKTETELSGTTRQEVSYVDAPPQESREEWEHRMLKGKVNGHINGRSLDTPDRSSS